MTCSAPLGDCQTTFEGVQLVAAGERLLVMPSMSSVYSYVDELSRRALQPLLLTVIAVNASCASPEIVNKCDV